MEARYSVGIVGATGAVGTELLRLIISRQFPLRELKLFASMKSSGIRLDVQGHPIEIEAITEGCFQGLDFVFFAAGGSVSKKYAPIAAQQGAIVIDNSSAFRMDDRVPLVIPEINKKALYQHDGIIANPNCSTIIMLMALAPLHQIAKIRRVVVSTYQAASGAGFMAMQDLTEETKALLNHKSYQRRVIPHPYAFNLFLHNSTLHGNDYTEEELKMVFETRKILNDPSINITATCVRVPVLRAHSEAINVEFIEPITVEEAYRALQSTQGITILEDRKANRFPMPIDATGKDEVFCGRIRKDLSQENTLDLWVVADQILKGAALNAIQIAETLLKLS